MRKINEDLNNLQEQFHDSLTRSIQGLSVIVMHPVTFANIRSEILEQSSVNAEYRDENFFYGVRIYRSLDIDEGKFIIS
jgi:hypothetical protein